MAHIIAASGKGPRSDAEVAEVEKGAYDNLILLCANCHTLIDKAPADFPEEMIRDWKRRHVERIERLFGAIEYPSRAAARNAIEPALAENRYVFEQFGPDNEYREDPESDLARVWQRKMRAVILPNNRKILAILDSNLRHLNKEEKNTLEAFRQHLDDLEAKHVAGVVDAASRFPSEMQGILTEAQNG